MFLGSNFQLSDFDLSITYPKYNKITRHIWNHKKGDYLKFERHLVNLDWDRILDTNDVDIATNRWYDIFYRLAKTYIPNKTVHISNVDLPYLTPRLRKLIRSKDHFFIRFTEIQVLTQIMTFISTTEIYSLMSCDVLSLTIINPCLKI